MAGYLFTLDSLEALHACVESGTYSTRIAPPRGYWGIPAEGTLADYATMLPGDNVYFFIQRRIYGIGELVQVGPDCKFQNFPGASSPHKSAQPDDSWLVPDGGSEKKARWTCVFRPSPHFFSTGVDMDDALASNPAAFRMLRVMWKLSFVKFDDEENQAFRDALLKANQHALLSPIEQADLFKDDHTTSHARIAALVATGEYALSVADAVRACASDTRLGHEMAIEAGLLDQLGRREEETVAVFGEWDYLSHQVVASPFKPVDYMDKMDVFGYAFIRSFRPTIGRYLVAEIKKDRATADDVEQLLKYVDWVKDEYAHGDYSMIRAFLIAHDFDPEAESDVLDRARRYFTVQRRPARTQAWNHLQLVRYQCEADSGHIAFTPSPLGQTNLVRL